MCIPTQGEVSTAHQTELFRSIPFPVPQLKFRRMPLGLVPHIFPAFHCAVRRSSCQMLHTTTAATVVDRCALLTSSAGKISSQRERIDLVPSRKAYFRQYSYQEERRSTKKHTQSPNWVQVNGCPMRRDSPLTAEAEKVDQNSKKILLSTRSTK